MDKIVVKGAREHNLKNIDVEIPRDKLVVITGLSGSGKSSLAFDTIYAEGQRRYVESLSAYARQFLEQMAKPDIDSIEGLSPAISIEQKTTSKNPRSTVGTVTEIYDYLRLLYARVGHVYCWQCKTRIASQTPQQMVDRVLEMPDGSRFSVLAPMVRDKKGEYKKELEQLRKDGYLRVAIDGELVDLANTIPKLDKNKKHSIEVYIDRLVLKDGIRQRLTESIEAALALAEGIAKISPLEGDDLVFSDKFACINCGISYPEISPRLFSFNNPHGACPDCDGIGAKMFFDPDLVVNNDELSLREGAIEPWEKRNAPFFQGILEAVAGHFKIDMYTPWAKLEKAQQDAILYGSKGSEIEFFFEKNGRRHTYKKEFEGVLANLERRLQEYERRRREEGGNFEESFEAVYEEFHRYMNKTLCEACNGTRLRQEARNVKIGGKSIVEISAQSIKNLHNWLKSMSLDAREKLIADRILRELTDRVGFLVNVGLDYLSLDRPAGTLSGGEGQRIRLATQIGSSLVGVLYILDEPSIGLHQRDNTRLLDTLCRLRDLGNTVIVVEHDEETIRAADHIIDMGPRAGVLGGRIVASGTPEEVMSSTGSLTGQYLSGRKSIMVPKMRRQPAQKYITLRGAKENNLRNLNVRFPVGLLTAITGVSGSGKSTLVIETLQKALQARLHRAKATPGQHDGIDGAHHVDKIIDIDQSPIGRTPRSNPATYTGLFTYIRDLFAALPESKTRGYKAGRYSFNVKGGRCESCQGDGILRIEMHFLPDVYVQCEACGGRRYNRETLEVRYKSMNIADVLDMTVTQAAEFMAHIPKLKQKLDTMREVGLGYITLGQSATTLSGGEAQRLKLSKELSKKATGRTIYILDEPTSGLHFDDIKTLLGVLNQLVDQGNTILVIEHNLDVIKTCDWVIDLGPEGGDGGGMVLAQGPPEEVAKVAASHTGRYLRKVLLIVEPSAAPIQVTGLYKEFAGARVVDGIDFHVDAGEIYGLIGPNGAGKTTTFRMLSGLLSPSGGRALVGGVDVGADPAAAKGRLGFSTGSAGLYGRLTAREQLHYFGALHGMSKQRLEERIAAVAETIDLTRLLDRRCEKLSTGEKQRVAIARALVHDPPVLILDEPTSGLDVLASRFLRDVVAGARRAGKAILFSTHYLAEAELLCDRVGFLHKGKILAEGHPEELREAAGAKTLEETFLKMATEAP